MVMVFHYFMVVCCATRFMISGDASRGWQSVQSVTITVFGHLDVAKTSSESPRLELTQCIHGGRARLGRLQDSIRQPQRQKSGRMGLDTVDRTVAMV